jgi:hypothetical protein
MKEVLIADATLFFQPNGVWDSCQQVIYSSWPPHRPWWQNHPPQQGNRMNII